MPSSFSFSSVNTLSGQNAVNQQTVLQQVHLLHAGSDDLLNQQPKLRLFRTADYCPQWMAHFVSRLLSRRTAASSYVSLTSLTIVKVMPPDVRALFTALAQLRQLIHLRLGLDIRTLEWRRLSPNPEDQLPSVRALDLTLDITTQSQMLQWLNLRVTLPNLSAIHLESITIYSIAGWGYINKPLDMNSTEAVEFFRAIIPSLHSGVPQEQIFYRYKNQLLSLEQFFQLNQQP